MLVSRVRLASIAVLAALIPSLLAVSANYVTQLNVHSSATISSMFGVYADANCTVQVKSLNWGTLQPGSNNSHVVYIRNTSPRTSTLFLSTRNWTPAHTTSYISLTWNVEGATISPNQTLEAMFTLTVSSSITGVTEFNFEIIISATEK